MLQMCSKVLQISQGESLPAAKLILRLGEECSKLSFKQIPENPQKDKRRFWKSSLVWINLVHFFPYRSARAHGFPDTVATYSLISSIWTSSFALGAFVGPTAAGKMSICHKLLCITGGPVYFSFYIGGVWLDWAWPDLVWLVLGSWNWLGWA